MKNETETSSRTRVYVDMVGDLFHPGHVALLKAARDFGDWLIPECSRTRPPPHISDGRS